MFVLYVFWGRRSFILIRYAVILAWFCPCPRGWFWPILYFLWETSTWHLDSCPPPPPPEDTWYDVILRVLRVLGQGLNQSARIFFIRGFSGCYAIIAEVPKRVACSRRWDSSESEKSFKNKKTRGGWGETGPLPSRARHIFALLV